jgi:hypothetical protein
VAAKTGSAHNAGWLALTAVAVLFLLSGAAVAQLALPGNVPVPGTGIPFGATGLTSPGLSPAPAPSGAIGITGTGTTCSAVGSLSPGMSGTSTNYDGGGLEMGASSSAGSATCGTTSNSGVVSAVAPTSPLTPGGVTPSGIPLGSYEINNLGVSPSVAVPAPSITMPTTTNLSPPTVGAGTPCSITSSYMPSTGC